MVTSKKPRREDYGIQKGSETRHIGGSILYRIFELSFEDSAPVKLFFFVRWFGDKQRRLMEVTGGGGGGWGC